ncbi:hypothetical protein [Clostridium estertheticum]|uniref:hypothetical protein n=1 Tax=Clostridium estertheticum TaxID=238834 RepID=UPI001C0E813C|nr:hypothetical protein [Clostridium estertheticum]MBU3171853.1 hypothetical protein [Clostridium estertheticum]
MSNIAREIKENLKLSKSLTEENDRIFTNIACYLRVSKLSDEEQKEIINDILMMFLDWQEEGKTVESMLGDGYKGFADNIIAAVNPKKHILKRIKKYFVALVDFSFIMLTIDFIFEYFPMLLKGTHNLNLIYNYTLDRLVSNLFIIIGASILVTYIGKTSFSFLNNRFYKLEKFAFVCGIVALLVLPHVLSLKISHIVIFSTNILYIIGIIVIYWVFRGVKKIMNYYI